MHATTLPRRLALACLLGATSFGLALSGSASTPTSEGTGEYVDDVVVTAKVRTAIFSEPNLSAAEINVETFKGRVQLSGFVATRDEIQRAGTIARGVAGVTSVVNNIRLK
jgi:osmotically-inducible protein OsmY